MADLKDKKNEVKSKFNAIRKASEVKKGVEDLLHKYDDDLANMNKQIGTTLDAFSDKANNLKSKIPNVDNIFEKITRDLKGILPVKEKDGESLLRRYTRESVNETVDSIKPIMLGSVQKLFFANDSDMGCGTSTPMKVDSLTISPKEFDFLDMLQTDPQTGLGKIVYENSVYGGKVKLNKDLYSTFNASTPYTFYANDETALFQMTWDSANQHYTISGLQANALTVDGFLKKYYESIEFPKISDILKNSLASIAPVGGINSTNSSMDVKTNELNRIINSICSLCQNPQNNNGSSLKQNAINQFSDNEVDLGLIFDFDSVEGIDIDQETLRYQKVMQFQDCNNFKVPVNQRIIEDFAFLTGTKNNITSDYNNALQKLAKDAYDQSGFSIPFPQFNANLDFQSMQNLPKALLSSIFSAKMFLPLAILYKMFKSATVSTFTAIKTLIKNLGKFVFNLIKDIFNKFLTVFWLKIRPEIAAIMKDLVKKIFKNSKKRYLTIINALIDILTALLPFVGIDSCDALYSAILALLAQLKTGISQKIPGLLLQLAKYLPGYSEDRAILNAVEFLEANGIPTGELYGQDNNVVSFVSSILKGHQKEMDQNSFIQVSLDYAQIPVAPLGGAAIIPPGLLKAHGKLT
jgi:hypothetical protein